MHLVFWVPSKFFTAACVQLAALIMGLQSLDHILVYSHAQARTVDSLDAYVRDHGQPLGYALWLS